jgi:diguanylate cyclase (GGDEF)-like protein
MTLVGSRWGDLLQRRERILARKALTKAQAGKIGNFTIPARDGRFWDVIVAPVRNGAHAIVKLVVISRDITSQQKAESKIVWAARHDSLTELANRSFLQNQLETAVHGAKASRESFGLLMLDIDHFKRTNDTHGHDAGDAVLRSFADRLKRASRQDDVVARLGGDEFAILLRGVKSETELEAALESISSSLRSQCPFQGALLDCSASIGAALYPEHGSTKEDLLKSADVALYAAKSGGRDNFKIFKPKMLARLERQHVMLRTAREALDEDRIVPFYQPKVDLRTRRIVGFEALLRWRNPTGKMQKPDTLSAAFSDGHLAPRLSRRIISCVLADMQKWNDAGVAVGQISFNAAAADFVRGDFADYLLERLSRASVPFSSLQLEVTETVFLGRGAECVEQALRILNAEGIEIALDDFGTGFASLTHLKNFPIDVIKIDRSFVRNMEWNAHNRSIVEAVVGLGRNLDISVVAEGIETELQHAELERMGCPLAQGFLYGKAAPFSEVEAMVNSSSISSDQPRPHLKLAL